MRRREVESAVALTRLERSGRVLVHGRTRGHGSDVDEGGVFEQTEVTKFGTTQGIVCVLVDGLSAVPRTVEWGGGIVESGRWGFFDRDGHFQRHVEIEDVVEIGIVIKQFFGGFFGFRERDCGATGRQPGLFSILNGGVDKDVEELVGENFGFAALEAEGGHGAGDLHPAADIVQQLVKEEATLTLRRVGVVGDGGKEAGAPASVIQQS
jgi:hypothetical protein